MLKTKVEKLTHVRNGFRIFVTTDYGNTFSLVIQSGAEPNEAQINEIWGNPQHRNQFVLEAHILNQEVAAS